MTAVEWLKFRYKNNINLMDYDFKQAIEMEKQQIIEAYDKGYDDFDVYEPEQYYDETYKKP
jgi:hypothetical protein